MTMAPMLFIGHGSPMNALEDNAFTRSLGPLAELCPSPRAVLCISAHWMTPGGTWVTHMPWPKTIHDFYGFPDALFAVQYPAPGNPKVAELVASTVKAPQIQPDDSKWGLDHGAWSVLRHVYPAANVPVVQLSLDMSQPPVFHFQLGASLKALRQQGVFIVASGNLVHNLRQIRWEHNAAPYPWATEFDAWTKHALLNRDFDALVNDFHSTDAGRLSVPSLDHYLPLLYVLGATEASDIVDFEFEEIHHGSIAMRTFSIGANHR